MQYELLTVFWALKVIKTIILRIGMTFRETSLIYEIKTKILGLTARLGAKTIRIFHESS